MPWKGHVHFFVHPHNEKTPDINLLTSSTFAANYPPKNKKSYSDTAKTCNASALKRCQSLLRSYFALCTKLNVDWQGSIIFQVLQLININLLIIGQRAVSFSCFLHSCLPSTHLIQICKFFYLLSFHAKLHTLYSNDLQTCNITWEYVL